MFCMVLSSAVLSAPPCCLATALVIYQIYLPLSTLLLNFFHFLFRLIFLSLYNAFMMLFPGSSVPTAGITAAAHLPQIFTVHVLKIPAKQQDSFQFFVIHKRIVCLCSISMPSAGLSLPSYMLISRKNGPQYSTASSAGSSRLSSPLFISSRNRSVMYSTGPRTMH